MTKVRGYEDSYSEKKITRKIKEPTNMPKTTNPYDYSYDDISNALVNSDIRKFRSQIEKLQILMTIF